MADLGELLQVLDLEPAGDGRFRAQNFDTGLGGVVFGGQLLAQSIVAASTVDPTKEVKSIHTVFARGGRLTSRSTSRSRPCTSGGPWPAPPSPSARANDCAPAPWSC